MKQAGGRIQKGHKRGEQGQASTAGIDPLYAIRMGAGLARSMLQLGQNGRVFGFQNTDFIRILEARILLLCRVADPQ